MDRDFADGIAGERMVPCGHVKLPASFALTFSARLGQSRSVFEPPGDCPICGADVPRRATACPQCGASHDTGWNDEVGYERLDLPDDEFDYDDFVKEEFGAGGRRHGRRNWVVAIAIFLLSLLVAGIFGMRLF